jgi:hypothetical protein
MANTVIRIKKTGVSGNVPGSLALGELALNYTDGLLYFANSTGITSFSANASVVSNSAFLQANSAYASQNTTASFANAAYTFANSINTYAYAAYAQANSGTSVYSTSAFNQANAAFIQANAAFSKANSGGSGTSLTYTAATTPPASGNNKGDQWYNTTTNVMYEWATDGTSYFWIDTSSPTVSNTANVNIVTTGNVNTNVVFANTVVANVNSTIIYSNTISVLGNVNANIIFANTITANYIGNGSQITGISASQISGLYANTNLSNYLSSTNISTSAITNTGNLTTGNLTVTGSANFVTNSNSSLSMTINNILETVNLQTTVGQTLVNFYVAQQSIMLNTTPATANMTLNITGHPSGAKLNTLLGVGQSITVAYGFTNGATTGYYINQLQIDGTNITPRYLGGNSQTGGDPSAVDMYTWTIIKTASTPTYNVFASNTKYA